MILLYILLKRLFFPLFDCLGILVENQLTTNIRVYFWTSNSTPLVYIPILKLLPYYLNYCSFVVSFEIGTSESSIFVLPFKTESLENSYDF